MPERLERCRANQLFSDTCHGDSFYLSSVTTAETLRRTLLVDGDGEVAMARYESISPAERRLRARLAAYAQHGHRDPREATAKARAAFLAKFERDADPAGVLPPEERRRRAESLRRAHFARLALASVKARRKAKGGDGPDEATRRQQSS